MVQKVLPFYLKNVQKLQNSMLLYLNYTSFEIRDILKFAMALCDELIANFEGYLYLIASSDFTGDYIPLSFWVGFRESFSRLIMQSWRIFSLIFHFSFGGEPATQIFDDFSCIVRGRKQVWWGYNSNCYSAAWLHNRAG